jgi:hypothetical protein
LITVAVLLKDPSRPPGTDTKRYGVRADLSHLV